METNSKPGVIRPWILITVIILIIAAIGFFTWHYLQKNNALPLPTTTPTTAPVVTPKTIPSSASTPVISKETDTNTPTTKTTATPAPTSNKFDGIISYAYSTSSTSSPYYHERCNSNVSFDYSITSKILDNSTFGDSGSGLAIANESGDKTFVHCLIMEPQTIDAYIEGQKPYGSNLQRQSINGYEVLIPQKGGGAIIINGNSITLTNVMKVFSDSTDQTDFNLILNSLKFK